MNKKIKQTLQSFIERYIQQKYPRVYELLVYPLIQPRQYLRRLWWDIQSIYKYGIPPWEEPLPDDIFAIPFDVVKYGKKVVQKYRTILPFIDSNTRIIDYAAGRGSLSYALDIIQPKADYLGLEVNDAYIETAKVLIKKDVIKCDLNNFAGVKELAERFRPNLGVVMYAHYYLKNPEGFLNLILDICPVVILGVKNGGWWNNRLRYLFGKEPIMRQYYGKGKKWHHDYYGYNRYQCYQDYIHYFKSANISYKLIGCRKEPSGLHKDIFMKSSRATCFIFLLSRSRDSICEILNKSNNCKMYTRLEISDIVEKHFSGIQCES